MNKKLITWTIILLVILAGIGIYFFYFYDWGNAESDVKKSKTEQGTVTETSDGKKIYEIPTELEGTFKSEAFDLKTSEIMFTIEGMKKTIGKFKDFTISYTKTSSDLGLIQVSIKIASIYTANSMRDEHIKEADFFNVEKFPEVTFKSSTITLGDTSYIATGELNFLGVKSEISIPFNYVGKGTNDERLIFDGKLNFDRIKHGMKEDGDVGNIAHINFYTELVK